ncbi:MAG: hypothetical protein LKH04_09295 [Lachnospiraceae bacterium]|nr:hypothetical protein [Lachnospiraceae bacterium]MCI1424472.1 hypothetical protein [Lachnospiraceae bacterium]
MTLAMLQKEVRPYGKIGKYLFEQMVAYNDSCADSPEWRTARAGASGAARPWDFC